MRVYAVLNGVYHAFTRLLLRFTSVLLLFYTVLRLLHRYEPFYAFYTDMHRFTFPVRKPVRLVLRERKPVRRTYVFYIKRTYVFYYLRVYVLGGKERRKRPESINRRYRKALYAVTHCLRVTPFYVPHGFHVLCLHRFYIFYTVIGKDTVKHRSLRAG